MPPLNTNGGRIVNDGFCGFCACVAKNEIQKAMVITTFMDLVISFCNIRSFH